MGILDRNSETNCYSTGCMMLSQLTLKKCSTLFNSLCFVPESCTKLCPVLICVGSLIHMHAKKTTHIIYVYMWYADIICYLAFSLWIDIKISDKMYHSSLLFLAIVVHISTKGNQRKWVKDTKLPSTGSIATFLCCYVARDIWQQSITSNLMMITKNERCALCKLI